jgi:lysozyme
MRHITEVGLRLIEAFEAFMPTPYLCPAGYWTIGYGHLLVGDRASWPTSISQEEAEALLEADVRKAEGAVLRLIRVPLSNEQFDALVSFTFNLGGGALQRSRLRSMVNREDHTEVPEEFLRWVRAGGKVLRGLVRRRAAEGRLYGTGYTL